MDKPVAKAVNANNVVEIMELAPIPAYLVWDGSNKDLNAALVYERLVDWQEDSAMRTHVQNFLCMMGHWRQNDEKVFISATMFFGMLPAEAIMWSNCRTI